MLVLFVVFPFMMFPFLGNNAAVPITIGGVIHVAYIGFDGANVVVTHIVTIAGIVLNLTLIVRAGIHSVAGILSYLASVGHLAAAASARTIARFILDPSLIGVTGKVSVAALVANSSLILETHAADPRLATGPVTDFPHVADT